MIKQYVMGCAVAFGLALPLVVAPKAAEATSVTLEYQGPTSGYKDFEITKSPATPAGSSVQAGAFRMKDLTGTFDDFIAWCADISAFLNRLTPNGYKTTNVPFSNSFVIGAAERQRMQDYFDANYVVGLERNRNRSSAFQVGLWEVIYDTDYSLQEDPTRSNEFAGTGSQNMLNQASRYLAAAQNYAGPRLWDMTFFESTSALRSQNIVTISSTATVPLPAAGWMLLAGLIGMFGLARRRRAQS